MRTKKSRILLEDLADNWINLAKISIDNKDLDSATKYMLNCKKLIEKNYYWLSKCGYEQRQIINGIVRRYSIKAKEYMEKGIEVKDLEIN